MVVSPEDEKRIVVRERLRLLSLGHYVYGGMGVMILPFFLPFMCMMMFFSFIPEEEWNKPSRSKSSSEIANPFASPTPSPTPSGAPPAIMFRIFAAGMGVFMLGLVALFALTAYSGWCIQKRKHKVLIYVMGAINCVFFPYGTVLGVSTILVMSSSEAQIEFGASPTR